MTAIGKASRGNSKRLLHDRPNESLVYHVKARAFPCGDPDPWYGRHQLPPTYSCTRIRTRTDLWVPSAFLANVRYLAMSPPDRAITTEDELDSAFQSLLLAALENGLDPRGAWEYRNGQTYPDLEVLVTELTKPD